MFSFSDGVLLYGDFATTFAYNKVNLLSTFLYSWSDASFLGYESSFYSFIRFPYYIVNDIINLLFGHLNYWVLFVVMYFLRYLFLFMYLRFLNISRSTAVLISFIYSINFYFIDRLGHTLISFGSITIPLVILSYQKLIEKGFNIKFLLLFVLSSWVIATSMHVSLMTFYFLVIYSIFNLYQSLKNNLFLNFLKINILIAFFTLFCLSYFILPLVYSSFFAQDLNVINQVSLKAGDWIYNFSSKTSFYNTLSGTGFYYSEILDHQFIFLIGFICNLSLIIYLFNFSNSVDKVHFKFYKVALLIFLGLSTINFSLPFIPFLKSYLVGFNSIKDNSYFILYAQFCFWVLISLSIDRFSRISAKMKLFSYFHLILVMLFFIFANIYAFTNFNNFKKNNIPEHYYQVSEFISNNGRILILPLGWVTEFNWSNGIMSGFFNLFFVEYQIVGQNIIEGPSFLTQSKLSSFINCFKSNCNELTIYIDELGVTQILDLSKNSYDVENPRLYKSKLSYNKQISTLLKKDLFKIDESFDDFQIYSLKNQNLKSKFIYPEGDYSKVNPTKYRIAVKNVSKNEILIFKESYHSQWKLFIREFNKVDSICSDNKNYRKSCNYREKFFEGEELKYLYEKPLFEESHKVVYDYANQWTIDPEYIKANFDKSYYKENPDGSIDVELVLYFRPQSYFYLGLIISLSTLTICIIYLIIDSVRQRKKSNPNVINLVRNLK